MNRFGTEAVVDPIYATVGIILVAAIVGFVAIMVGRMCVRSGMTASIIRQPIADDCYDPATDRRR